MIKATLLTFVLLAVIFGYASGTEVEISFSLVTNNKGMTLPATMGETRVDVVRFYVSSVALYRHGKSVWQEHDSYHLVDFSGQGPVKYQLKVPGTVVFDNIRFNLGVDSSTNVSGAMGGDLDPAKGMYWTWQSGYINFKMEGAAPAAPTPRHEFHFHLGGYAGPDATLQTIELPVTKTGPIQIGFDMGLFLGEIDFGKTNNIMSPGAGAAALAKRAGRSFFVAP